MPASILIAYATRTGSTAEVAQALGRSLRDTGHDVKVAPMTLTAGIGGFDAVLLGSAIRMGAWLPEAMSFVRRHRDALSKVPVALFTCHLNNLGDAPTAIAARRAYTEPVHQLITPAAEAYFAGAIDMKKLPFLERLMVEAVKKNTGLEPGDYRDWMTITSWAEGIPASLEAARA